MLQPSTAEAAFSRESLLHLSVYICLFYIKHALVLVCTVSLTVAPVCAGGEESVVGLLVTDGQLSWPEGGSQVPVWWTDVD